MASAPSSSSGRVAALPKLPHQVRAEAAAKKRADDAKDTFKPELDDILIDSMNCRVPWFTGFSVTLKAVMAAAAMWSVVSLVGSDAVLLASISRDPVYTVGSVPRTDIVGPLPEQEQQQVGQSDTFEFVLPVCSSSQDLFLRENGTQAVDPPTRMVLAFATKEKSGGDPCFLSDVGSLVYCWELVEFDAGKGSRGHTVTRVNTTAGSVPSLPSLPGDSGAQLSGGVVALPQWSPSSPGILQVVSSEYHIAPRRSECVSEQWQEEAREWATERGGLPASTPEQDLPPAFVGRLQRVGEGGIAAVLPRFPSMAVSSIHFICLMATLAAPMLMLHIEALSYSLEAAANRSNDKGGAWVYKQGFSFFASGMELLIIGTQAELIGISVLEGWPAGAATSNALIGERGSAAVIFCTLYAVVLFFAVPLLAYSVYGTCMGADVPDSSVHKGEVEGLKAWGGAAFGFLYLVTIFAGCLLYVFIAMNGDLRVSAPSFSSVSIANSFTWEAAFGVVLATEGATLVERIARGALDYGESCLICDR